MTARKSTNVIIAAIVLSLAVLFGLLWFLLKPAGAPTNNSQSSTSTTKPKSTNPKSTTNPNPPSIQITSLQGKVTAVGNGSLTVDSQGKSQTLNIKDTKDIQKLSSGTLQAGNAKTGQATISDVKVGSQVMLVLDKDTTNVRTILIISN